MLGERQQLRHDHILERHDGQLHAQHVQHLGPLERVAGVEAGRPEDHVNQHAVLVPGLDEPFLRRFLAPQPRLLERLDRLLRLLLADHEVEVVGRLRPATRPRREAAGEREVDPGVAQCRGRLLHRRADVLERLAPRHSCVIPPAGVGKAAPHG